MTENGQPLAAAFWSTFEDTQQIEQVLAVRGAQDIQRIEEGLRNRVGSHQGAGVRAGGSGSRFRASDFQDENRLAFLRCPAGKLRKSLAVPDALDIAAKNAHVLLVEQIVPEVGELDIDFV